MAALIQDLTPIGEVTLVRYVGDHMWITFRDGQSALAAARKRTHMCCGQRLRVRLKTGDWLREVRDEIQMCTANTVPLCDVDGHGNDDDDDDDDDAEAEDGGGGAVTAAVAGGGGYYDSMAMTGAYETGDNVQPIDDYNSLGIPSDQPRPKSPARPAAPPARPPQPMAGSPKHAPQRPPAVAAGVVNLEQLAQRQRSQQQQQQHHGGPPQRPAPMQPQQPQQQPLQPLVGFYQEEMPQAAIYEEINDDLVSTREEQD